jgi:hypothetical protein
MYILSCVYISFKVNTSVIQTTRAPQEINSAPGGERAARFENLCAKRSPAPDISDTSDGTPTQLVQPLE